MKKKQILTTLIILSFTIKCDDPIECSNDIILEEACAKLKGEDEGKICYFDGSQCLSEYNKCSFYTGTNEEECSNINLRDFRYKCTLENNECVEKKKLCSDYNKGKGREFYESLSGGSDNKHCVYKSGDICDTDFNECKDANEDKCLNNIPSDNKYKCIFQNNGCKSIKRKCSEYLNTENCWDLEAGEQGKSCLYKDGCIENYKYCEHYMGEIDEDICVKIKPYIKGTNNIDYSHKCSKKNNKCVTIQRECEDYDSNTESSYYCTQINFEGNHNKKCFLDGNNCEIIYLDCDGYTGEYENECKNIIPRYSNGNKKPYIKCKFENSKCVNMSRECGEFDVALNILDHNYTEIEKNIFCNLLSPSDKNNMCIYKTQNICLELPKKCEDYMGNSKEECELILTYNYSYKCIYENNNCKMKQRENCSDIRYPDNQYICNDIVLSETKRCLYYDKKCQEFYKKCEDYKGKDRLICESIQPYKSMLEIDEDYECIFEKDSTCTKKKKEEPEYCNYYGSNDELCTLQTPSDPSIKVCARNGYRCFEQYKYCSEYKGLASEECESITPYDPETNKKDLYSKCEFVNKKCVKRPKKCNEYNGYDSKICSKYSAEDENKVCALKGNSCTEQYKTCEAYTENDPDICNSIILNDFTKKCEFKASSGGQPAKCVTKDRTCSEFDFGFTGNFCENHLLNNYTKKCSYRYGSCQEYINSCEEIIFENINEATEEKCNVIDVSSNYICTLKSDKSGCRSISKDDYEE